MTIPERFLRQTLTIDAEACTDEAARIMGEFHVGSLVVTREGAPIGIVTDRDLAMYVLPDGLDGATIPVRECMSAPLVSVGPGTSLLAASRHMRECKVRRLPVLDDAGALAGFVAADDILCLLARELGDLSVALRRGFDREAHAEVPAGSIFGRE